MARGHLNRALARLDRAKWAYVKKLLRISHIASLFVDGNQKKKSSAKDRTPQVGARESAMNITVKLYALLGRYLPPDSENNVAEIVVADGRTIMDVVRHLNVPAEHCHLVLVNGLFVSPSERETRVLQEGDALAIWPPVAGG